MMYPSDETRQGATIWLTGLSGSGKSTIAFSLKKYLNEFGLVVCCLDGDIIRQGLNKDLVYSRSSSIENVRRVGEVAKLFSSSGSISIVSLISPHKEIRDEARRIHVDNDVCFIEVYLNTPLSTCQTRDTKGLYHKAKLGLISNMVGIDVDYDVPQSPDLIIDTNIVSIDQSIQMIFNQLIVRNKIPQLKLVELFSSKSFIDEFRSKEDKWIKIEIDQEKLRVVKLLSEGWASPLTGFMSEEEYIHSLHTVDFDHPPILFSCSDSDRKRIQSNQNILLYFNTEPVALMRNIDIFKYCGKHTCQHRYRNDFTQDFIFKFVDNQSEFIASGQIEVFERIFLGDPFDELRLTPHELRTKFLANNSDIVLNMEVEGPFHNGHLHLIKQIRQDLIQRGYQHPTIIISPFMTKNPKSSFSLEILVEQYRAYFNFQDVDHFQSLNCFIAFLTLREYFQPDNQFNDWFFRSLRLSGIQYYAAADDRIRWFKENLFRKHCIFLPLKQLKYHRQTLSITFNENKKTEEYELLPTLDKDFVEGIRDEQEMSWLMPLEAFRILKDSCQQINSQTK